MSELFKTYERTVIQRREIAVITEENIGQIAALVKGKVDYSYKTPEVLQPPEFGNGPFKVGTEVSLLNGTPPKLQNMSGFNREGDWKEAQP